jgi:SAM-dependent methyltransferase
MSEKMYLDRPVTYYEPYLRCFGKAEGPLLDMGCGHGHFLLLAKQKGIAGYGVELSQNRVTICKSKGLDVKKHDLRTNIPFPDSFFGMVYCGQVIEHVPHDGQTMLVQEAFRVLKHGGIFQVRSPNWHNKSSRKPGREYLITIKELCRLLSNAGFIRIDTTINIPQKLSLIPDFVLKFIFKKFPLDYMSASSNCLCYKP